MNESTEDRHDHSYGKTGITTADRQPVLSNKIKAVPDFHPAELPHGYAASCGREMRETSVSDNRQSAHPANAIAQVEIFKVAVILKGFVKHLQPENVTAEEHCPGRKPIDKLSI